MSVIIGEVPTFKDVSPTKEQALKPLEESAEVFAAWQLLCGTANGKADKCMECNHAGGCDSFNSIVDECADVIQAVSNLLESLGAIDMRNRLVKCRKLNELRGRQYADNQ